jgi:hypothetical protein
VLDLTDAGGEVFPWASSCCDMGPTLVRPSRWRRCESVAECVAGNAGWAPGTVARMRSLGAAETQRRASWGGLAGVSSGAGGGREGTYVLAGLEGGC